MKTVKVIFGVDVETDVGSFTPFYEGVKHGIPKLIDIFERNGIEATFFFTGESAKLNPEMVHMVDDAGHEVGCHSLYHETVGDELFPIPGVKPLLPHEIKPRLKMATQWIEEILGKQPVSFRSPRLWGSTHVVNALEDLGYVCDASYPMYFYRKQFAPYFPSRENWLEKGESKVLELPNFADMVMESNDSPLERDRDQWPLFRTKGAEYVYERCENFIGFCEEKDIDPVLVFYIHPWEFHPMESEFNFGEATVIPDPFIIENCGDVASKELEKLIVMLKKRGCSFHRCDNLAREMTKEQNEDE
ncbi:MAG: polysaccharide deacetylase family protein [Sphaerochaetaceae bacterium]|nr:polysaccharide deacetylase family protein [Sphaerochaetaceae bacterium]